MTGHEDSADNQLGMPPAEVDISVELIRRLLADQHPDLATQQIRPLANGWDNVLFRLGEDSVVRLPRRQLSAGLVEHEQRWLPVLAPNLPIPVPVPTRIGRPTEYYPWPWSIQPWFPGAAVGNDGWQDPSQSATDLGCFLAALHTPAPPDRPINVHRGGPLANRHEMTVERINRFSPRLDVATQEALDLWNRCRRSEPWAGPPMWIHGDLHLFNLIQDTTQQDITQQDITQHGITQHGGRLSAVIDFGDICGGDPACDLAIGWSAFDHRLRMTFRDAANSVIRPIDDDMWMRARGWCLSFGYTLLAFSADNPSHEQMAIQMVRAALDH